MNTKFDKQLIWNYLKEDGSCIRIVVIGLVGAPDIELLCCTTTTKNKKQKTRKKLLIASTVYNIA